MKFTLMVGVNVVFTVVRFKAEARKKVQRPRPRRLNRVSVWTRGEIPELEEDL